MSYSIPNPARTLTRNYSQGYTVKSGVGSLLIDSGVYIGDLGITSSFGMTVENLGKIDATEKSGVSLDGGGEVINYGSIVGVNNGVRFHHLGTVVNYGSITGGTVSYRAGVFIEDGGSVNNKAGEISGGTNGGPGILVYNGYATLNNDALVQGGSQGGFGVRFRAGGNINNSGKIYGGAGNGGGAGYDGGVGVYMRAAGSVVNSGKIYGGAGSNGTGVLLVGGGTLVNRGAIFGGAGSGASVGVGLGGVGAVTNYGVIAGVGGGGSIVLGSSAARLIAEPGSQFIGLAYGGGGTFELAGGAGTITGLGGTGTLTGAVSATVRDFGSYVVDAGASWSLAGAAILAAGQTLAVHGTVKLGSSGSLANAGVVKARTGAVVVLKGAVDNSGVLKAKGGELTIKGTVSGSGSAAINGGVLTIDPAFGENVAFNGPSGELVLEQSQAFSGQISGFSTAGGTSLDLEDIAFVDASQASFLGTTSSGVLTVSDGTHTAHITLVGDYTNSVFIASSDGHGGTIVVDPSATVAVQRFAATSAGFGAYTSAAQTPARVNWTDPPMMMAAIARTS